MCASWSGDRWQNAVQMRWECDQCGETHLVARIGWHGDEVRLCRVCWLDGFWKEARKQARKQAHSHAEKGKG